MYTRLRSCASAAILIAAAFANLQTLRAQTESKPKWSLITFTSIKPEMRSEYEAWQKQLSAAYKKAEVPSRTVVQTIMGDLFEYVSIAPLAKFADFGRRLSGRARAGQGSGSGFHAQRSHLYYVSSSHRKPRHG